MTVPETPIYNQLRNKYLDALHANKELRSSMVSLYKLLAVQQKRIDTLKNLIEVKNERIRILEGLVRD